MERPKHGFKGIPGQALQLEASSDFDEWQVITKFTTGDEAVVLNDPAALGLDGRFYRIVPQLPPP